MTSAACRIEAWASTLRGLVIITSRTMVAIAGLPVWSVVLDARYPGRG
jgi:hypothetical protein